MKTKQTNTRMLVLFLAVLLQTYSFKILNQDLKQILQNKVSGKQQQSVQCFPSNYVQFLQKIPTNAPELYPKQYNPYGNHSEQYLKMVQENLNNKERVCAIRYENLSSKQNFELKNFQTRSKAESQNWTVTHQGICGKCSTLQDLYVYLTTDLTRPVRSCGLKHPFSHKSLHKCIKQLGFTESCTQIWVDNTLYTRKKCGFVCFLSYITNQPFIIDGQLNKCLQCDQDNSGPVFKFQSGRTRRNSGIKSEIDRPDDQIYNLTHCYF